MLEADEPSRGIDLDADGVEPDLWWPGALECPRREPLPSHEPQSPPLPRPDRREGSERARAALGDSGLDFAKHEKSFVSPDQVELPVACSEVRLDDLDTAGLEVLPREALSERPEPSPRVAQPSFPAFVSGSRPSRSAGPLLRHGPATLRAMIAQVCDVCDRSARL
jgi:hypothetical protein